VKVLVVGNGGREHALAWKLLQSPRIDQCICVPGNGGTATLPGCQNLPLSLEDFEGIARTALAQSVELVVVGPELPLSLGIADYLSRHQLPVFGPTRVGAQIEASKSWAKTLLAEAGVAIAQGATFTEPAAAKAYASERLSSSRQTGWQRARESPSPKPLPKPKPLLKPSFRKALPKLWSKSA
jgi:phosphoribosylamine--glycine ligase